MDHAVGDRFRVAYMGVYEITKVMVDSGAVWFELECDDGDILTLKQSFINKEPREVLRKLSPNWGGDRPGAGRPSSEHPRQQLIINCTDEELKIIQDGLGTRGRAEILLGATK